MIKSKVKGETMESKEYLYDAFISYRHLPIDAWAAEKVHKTLETYRLPKKVARKFKKTEPVRIFRDKEELVSSGDLAAELRSALECSRYLILICSSKTIESEWVMKEVQTFKELGRQSQILILLVEGKPDIALPQMLRTHEKRVILPDGGEIVTTEEVEPLAADIRGKTKRERERKFKSEILRIIAPVMGCSYDDLKQRQKERSQKKIAIGSLIVALGIVAFGVYNAWRVSQIQSQMRAKLAVQSRALADQSVRLLEKGDRMRALLVALEALPKNMTNPERPMMDEVQYALSNALYTYNFDMGMRADKSLEYSNVIMRAVLSPDGSKAFTVSEDMHFQIWDMTSSSILMNLPLVNSYYYEDFASFIDEEHILIYDDGKLQLMSIADKKTVWEKTITEGEYTVFNDGTIGVYNEEQIMLLDSSNGNVLFSQSLPEEDYYYAWFMAKDESNKRMLVGNGNRLFIIDIATGKILADRQLEEECVSGIVPVSDGTFIVSLNPLYEDILAELKEEGDTKLERIAYDGGNLTTQWKRHFGQGELSLLRVTNDEKEAITVVQGQRFFVLDHQTGESIKEYVQPTNIIGYTGLEDAAYVASEDGNVRLLIFEDTLAMKYMDMAIEHDSNITSYDFKHGTTIMTEQGEKRVYIYKWLTGQEETLIDEEDDYIYDIGCDKQLDYLYVRDGKDEIRVYKDNGKTFLYTIKVDEGICDIGFVGKGQYIYIMTYSGIRFWSLTSGEQVAYIQDNEEYSIPLKVVQNEEDDKLYCVFEKGVIALDGKTLKEEIQEAVDDLLTEKIVVTEENTLLGLDIEGRLVLLDLLEKKSNVVAKNIQDFAVDNKDKLLALYKEDNRVEIYKQKDQTILWQSEEPMSCPISYMAFEEGEQKLWIGYGDTRIEIIDLKSGNREEVADDFSYTLEKISFFKEQDKVILYTQDNNGQNVGIVYRRSKMTKLAKVQQLYSVSDDCSYFYIVGYGGYAYVVPFYSTEQLAAEAVKQLEGRTLTDKEKRQYFIEE